MRRARRRLVALAVALLAGACTDAPSATRPGAAGAEAAAPADPAAVEAARKQAVALDEAGGLLPPRIDALRAALALQPDHYGLNYRLGRNYAELRLHEQALEHFLRAWQARPDDLLTLLSIVTLQVRLEKYDEALRHIEALLADEALRGEALYQQALAHDQQGRRDLAREALRAAADLPAERAYRCRAMEGRLLLEDGEFLPARAAFEAARSGRPDYKEALKGLADVSRRLGDEPAAQRWDELLGLFIELTDNVQMRAPEGAAARRAVLERIVAAYPDWPAGFQQLADAQLGAGERDAACATVRAYAERYAAALSEEQAHALLERYCGGAAR